MLLAGTLLYGVQTPQDCECLTSQYNICDVTYVAILKAPAAKVRIQAAEVVQGRHAVLAK